MFNAGDIIEYYYHEGIRCVGVITSFHKHYQNIANVEWLLGLYGYGSVNLHNSKKLTG